MSDPQRTPDLDELRNTLLTWLKRRIDDTAYSWITTTEKRIREDDSEDWEFFSAFSAVPRHTGKEPLRPTDIERKQAGELRYGWNPLHWSLDQTGRTLLLIGIAGKGKEEFLDKLEKTFISSDMGEAVALYQSLQLLPWPEELKERAAEGIRSNITTVFEVIALNNPYPADYLDDGAWNQMVLKALFVGSPLYPIQGIDERSNPELAKMLVEYAHERWSAGREVSPELWRPVGNRLTREYLRDIERVLDQSEEIQRFAALLALRSSNLPEAAALLERHADLTDKIESEAITWEVIGKQFELESG